MLRVFNLISVENIEAGAFAGCTSLTIFAQAPSQPSGWHPGWNPNNRPVMWGSTVSDEDEVFPIYTAKLIGNYPNPFNPETTISFSVATEGNVVINIYNVKGQKVKNLVNGNFNTGMHSIIWNGLSDNGQKVGTGVYFYQMFTNDNVDVKRMLLLK